MNKLLILLIAMCLLAGCKNNTQTLQVGEEGFRSLYIDELGALIDSSFKKGDDLSAFVKTKAIRRDGSIEKVSFEKAMTIYSVNKKRKPSEMGMFPIFEVKNSSQVVIAANGLGLWDNIWGDILIDRKTMEIIGLQFDHKGETPGLGAKITSDEFESQFKSQKITYSDSSQFGLIQNGEIQVVGKYQIDGITGATITGKGLAVMLNETFAIYRPYFEKK